MIPTANPSPQPKQHLEWFSHFRTGDRGLSLYFTMGRPFPLCPFPWGIWILDPSNIWFPGPTRVLNPNGISIGAAVFGGLTSVTDRQTDRQIHATRSVTIGRIYVSSTVMRPNKKVDVFCRTVCILTQCVYTVFHKNHGSELMSITLSNLNRFSKLFHYMTLQ